LPGQCLECGSFLFESLRLNLFREKGIPAMARSVEKQSSPLPPMIIAYRQEGETNSEARSRTLASQAIDEALALQLISIRLQKSLIENFKFIATLNGIGYQPLMRQILKRFVDSEKKRILRERAGEVEAQVVANKPQQRQKTERGARVREAEPKAA
jgi:uncharacterized protein (DUF4415 family)